MKIYDHIPQVLPRSSQITTDAWEIWDEKVKPQLSLGRLEHIVVDIANMVEELHPQVGRPQLLLFAADHGIVAEKVSSSPQEITWQQCENFARGEGAIGLLCNLNGLDVHVIDVGVAHTFTEQSGIIGRKIGWGTHNFLHDAAMTEPQLSEALQAGASMVQGLYDAGHRIFAFGEMGIGNTTSASAIMACSTPFSIEECTGRGAGLDDAGMHHKCSVIKQALQKWGPPTDPLEILRIFGGFEIAAIVGGMIQAAHDHSVILVDGFITTVAAAIAIAVRTASSDYMIFCHESQEAGHARLLEYLHVQPVISLSMRLGEGTGAAVAWPIIRSALQLYEHMNSFASAQVTDSVSLLKKKGVDAHAWEEV
jgi:nicotinate-nucleotide--dimethylbenzimidazole phosphoribosyltransferase